MTRQPRRGRWLICPRPDPSARLRLFAFPYAGAGASVFYDWPDMLPPGVDLCAVQLPGREGRLSETPYVDFGQLIPSLAAALLPAMDRPFAFFGHSIGAVIAFELARALRRQGRQRPVVCFVSGRSAPQFRRQDPPIHHLPQAEFLAELRRLNGTPEEILRNEELMRLLMPLLRADFELGWGYAYTHEPPLDVPISAFGGWEDMEVAEDEMLGWREQTSGAFSHRMLPGDHFFLHAQKADLLAELGTQLRAFHPDLRQPAPVRAR